MIDRIEFGQRLRRERERQAISLPFIAQSTKIKLSVLDAFERGDLSQWPDGLYGRGFLRAYLAAIHVPAEPLVAEFQELCAAPSTRDRAKDGARDAHRLRLTLDPDTGGPPPIAKRILAALADIALLLAAAALISRLGGVNFWIVGTAAASIGSVAVTIWSGRSPILWWADRQSARLAALPADPGHIDVDDAPRLTLVRD